MTVREIVSLVSRETGTPEVDILSDRRDGATVWARHLVMWLARKSTTLSLPAIGRQIRRDHTTVLYGVRTVDWQRTADVQFKSLTDRLLAAANQLRRAA